MSVRLGQRAEAAEERQLEQFTRAYGISGTARDVIHAAVRDAAESVGSRAEVQAEARRIVEEHLRRWHPRDAIAIEILRINRDRGYGPNAIPRSVERNALDMATPPQAEVEATEARLSGHPEDALTGTDGFYDYYTDAMRYLQRFEPPTPHAAPQPRPGGSLHAATRGRETEGPQVLQARPVRVTQEQEQIDARQAAAEAFDACAQVASLVQRLTAAREAIIQRIVGPQLTLGSGEYLRRMSDAAGQAEQDPTVMTARTALERALEHRDSALRAIGIQLPVDAQGHRQLPILLPPEVSVRETGVTWQQRYTLVTAPTGTTQEDTLTISDTNQILLGVVAALIPDEVLAARSGRRQEAVDAVVEVGRDFVDSELFGRFCPSTGRCQQFAEAHRRLDEMIRQARATGR